MAQDGTKAERTFSRCSRYLVEKSSTLFSLFSLQLDEKKALEKALEMIKSD
jgi:hypothetical protein